MKTTKMILAATLIGVAAVSAQARGFFGISIGVAVPTPVVVVSAPVYVAPVPVVYAPAPVIVQPPCPGVGYVWNAGYWNAVGYNRVWVPGNWQYRPSHVAYGYGYSHGYNGNNRGYNYGGNGWHR